MHVDNILSTNVLSELIPIFNHKLRLTFSSAVRQLILITRLPTFISFSWYHPLFFDAIQYLQQILFNFFLNQLGTSEILMRAHLPSFSLLRSWSLLSFCSLGSLDSFYWPSKWKIYLYFLCSLSFAPPEPFVVLDLYWVSAPFAPLRLSVGRQSGKSTSPPFAPFCLSIIQLAIQSAVDIYWVSCSF